MFNGMIELPESFQVIDSDDESTLTPSYSDNEEVGCPLTVPPQFEMSSLPVVEMTTSSSADAIRLLANGLDAMINTNDPSDVVRGIVSLREASGHHSPMDRWNDLTSCQNIEYLVSTHKKELEDLKRKVAILTKTVMLTEQIIEKTRSDLHRNINRDLVELEPRIRHMFE
jgi:hypothetical protein